MITICPKCAHEGNNVLAAVKNGDAYICLIHGIFSGLGWWLEGK